MPFSWCDPFEDWNTDDVSDEFRPIPDDEESDEELDAGENKNAGAQKDKWHVNERSTMPAWLLTNYADAREHLTAKMKKNPSQKPTCYT